MLIVLVLSPFVAITAVWEDIAGRRLRRRFTSRWGGEGKHGLLVYSNSPHWQEYIEREWLPRWGDRLVVANWSERKRWPRERPLEHAIFRRWAGRREFNPIAIVFRPPAMPWATMRAWAQALRRLDPAGMLSPNPPEVEIIRFHRPFRNFRHGKPQSLRAAEERLTQLLGE